MTDFSLPVNGILRCQHINSLNFKVDNQPKKNNQLKLLLLFDHLICLEIYLVSLIIQPLYNSVTSRYWNLQSLLPHPVINKVSETNFITKERRIISYLYFIFCSLRLHIYGDIETNPGLKKSHTYIFLMLPLICKSSNCPQYAAKTIFD